MPAKGAVSADPKRSETQSDRARWESRYADRDAPQAPPPAALVVEHLHRVHAGRALDLAMGAGHNAVYCAQHGFQVAGVDISLGAVRAAKDLARRSGAPIRGIVADLEGWPVPSDAFDLILNLRYLQRSLFGPIKAALRPGGLLLFETFTVDHIAPHRERPLRREYLLERNELLHSFSNLHIIRYTEDMMDGSAVASLVARKA